MQGSGGSSKAVLWTIGIIALVVIVLYFAVEVGDIKANVKTIADNQKARPNRGLDEPIDVTPEKVAKTVPSTIVVQAPQNVTETQIHSENQDRSANCSKEAIEKPNLTANLDSEIDSSHSENAFSESTPEFRHSEDFRTINHQGQEYHLTLNQAQVVERLLAAHENKTPEVHQDTLLVNLGIYSKRVRDVFKNSSAFGTLVIKGERKGNFRLNLG
jgi:hypothetical protein